MVNLTSRGGVTGGMTISDAIGEYEARGYTGQFKAGRGGAIECLACSHQIRPEDTPLGSLRRIEGASDPADMCAVGALECPDCHARGTLTLCFGPGAPPEDGEILRRLEDLRPSQEANLVADDRSLVSDTGWLPGSR